MDTGKIAESAELSTAAVGACDEPNDAVGNSGRTQVFILRGLLQLRRSRQVLFNRREPVQWYFPHPMRRIKSRIFSKEKVLHEEVGIHGQPDHARVRELELGNARLKKMYAGERLKAEILKEAMAKNGKAVSPEREGQKRR